VSENRARYPIAVMCRVLDVSASGYYTWVKRPPSMRAVTDAALTAKIHAAHVASNGTYGAPRLQIDLAEAGIRVGRKRVARLMRNAGFVGAFTWVSITYHIRASLCGGDSRAGAHQHAVVLTPVKERPGSIAANRAAGVPAVLDSRARRDGVGNVQGRDGKMPRGQTKRLPQRGGQNAVRPDTLIPRPRLSTKPGQAQTTSLGS
jgi:hypothetical protein